MIHGTSLLFPNQPLTSKKAAHAEKHAVVAGTNQLGLQGRRAE